MGVSEAGFSGQSLAIWSRQASVARVSHTEFPTLSIEEPVCSHLPEEGFSVRERVCADTQAQGPYRHPWGCHLLP